MFQKKMVEIVPLTSVRGIAALWVVVFHLVNNLSYRGLIAQPNPIIGNLVLGGSNIAVDIFFILSGYIMAETYGARSNSGTFFAHRIARIVPLHIVVLTILAVGIAVFEHFGIRPESEEFFAWGALPYHYLLISVWFGLVGWNGPTWSLNAEMAAYLTFPTLQWICRKLDRTLLVAFGCALLVGYFILLQTVGFKSTGFAAIGRGLFGFSAGMLLRLGIDKRMVPGWLAILCVFTISGIGCFGFYEFAIFPSALLIVALGSSSNGIISRILSHSLVHWLGRVSYGIYLIHVPLLIAGMQILRRMTFMQSHEGVAIWVTAYLTILFLSADIAWRYVEMPARRAIRVGWEAFERRWILDRGSALGELQEGGSGHIS
jgi:peptidoglycan/LPS O-acetylase OafA/YrhL